MSKPAGTRIGATVALAVALLGATAEAGYTHYWIWRRPPTDDELRPCIADMQRIAKAWGGKLEGSFDEEGATAITLNGVGEDAHEAFRFPGLRRDVPLRGPDGGSFEFCKTQWKPYDEVVTACLIAARDHFPPDVLEIMSDGVWGEWTGGARLYHRTLGRPLRNPMGGPDFGPGGHLGDDPSGRAGVLRWAVPVIGLLAVITAWLKFGRRGADFVIAVGPEEIDVVGKIPAGRRGEIIHFFKFDMAARKSRFRVYGYRRPGRAMQLTFSGGLDEGQKQRIRNFLFLILGK